MEDFSPNVLGLLRLFLVCLDKGVGVVATPDGVWHRDSHYRSQLIGGVHKLMIFIRGNLEDFL